MRKALFLTLGTICVILGLIGIAFPVLPTTPFLLLAAFFYTRSSDHALHWLLTNRWFGPYIRNYREGRGMALKDKIITISFLWITIILSVVFVIESLWVRILIIGIATAVTTHLVRINTYRKDSPSTVKDSVIEVE